MLLRDPSLPATFSGDPGLQNGDLPPDWYALTTPDWSQTAILFADLVESVRLMELDEVGVVMRWRHFVAWVTKDLLPACQGRMVKSLGDGFLLEFKQVHDAVKAAHRLHIGIQAFNRGATQERCMWLRVGVHLTRVLRDDTDLYGSGVNLGARIAASARPGQTVVSAAARARIVPALDGAIQDLGECYLKNLEGTHRLFSVAAPSKSEVLSVRAGTQFAGLKPRIALAPMQLAEGSDQSQAAASTLTDHLIASLSQSDQWAVTSRLSIGALGERQLDRADLAALLNVQYLLCSSLHGREGGHRLQVSLYEHASRQTIWEDEQPLDIRAVLADAAALGSTVAADLSMAIIKRQINLSHKAALPTLAGYTLFLSAISRLHSLGQSDMHSARSMFEHLVDRYPRAPEARVWLAKWHFLQVAQVTASDVGDAVRRARAELDRARELDPDHALAWALSGHLSAYADGDLLTAEDSLRHALKSGPNESLTSLFLAQLYADTDRGADAVRAVEAAHRLSPLDPMGYYYLLFAASAYSSAGRHDEALRFTRESLRLNTVHLSSWVQLIIDLVLTERMDEARDSARHYLVLRPAASVARYRDRHAGKGNAIAERNAQALVTAGLPW